VTDGAGGVDESGGQESRSSALPLGYSGLDRDLWTTSPATPLENANRQ